MSRWRDLGLIDSFLSVIFLYTAINTPFNVYLMTAFYPGHAR